jgi:hypothetical protein
MTAQQTYPNHGAAGPRLQGQCFDASLGAEDDHMFVMAGFDNEARKVTGMIVTPRDDFAGNRSSGMSFMAAVAVFVFVNLAMIVMVLIVPFAMVVGVGIAFAHMFPVAIAGGQDDRRIAPHSRNTTGVQIDISLEDRPPFRFQRLAHLTEQKPGKDAKAWQIQAATNKFDAPSPIYLRLSYL